MAIKELVYLTNSVIPSHTANSIQVMTMCQAFAKECRNVKLVVPFFPQKLLTEPKNFFQLKKFYGVQPNSFSINFLPIPQFGYKGFLIDFFLQQALIYAKWTNPELIYTRKLRLAKRLVNYNFNVVVECHQYTLFKERGDLNDLLSVADSKNFKLIVVISEELKNLYVKEGIPKQKILVAHDGVSEADIISSENLKNIYKNQRKKVIYAGKLTSGKGLNILIDAAKLLPNLDFEIIGGKRGAVKEWREYTAQKGVRNVDFKGFVSPSFVKDYLKEADILVAPYSQELDYSNVISPLKLFEYMSLGKPVVVSDLPSIREVVKHNFDAILVKPDSVSSLKKGIEMALEPESKELGRNALTTVKNYTWEQRAKKILSAIPLSYDYK